MISRTRPPGRLCVASCVVLSFSCADRFDLADFWRGIARTDWLPRRCSHSCALVFQQPGRGDMWTRKFVSTSLLLLSGILVVFNARFSFCLPCGTCAGGDRRCAVFFALASHRRCLYRRFCVFGRPSGEHTHRNEKNQLSHEKSPACDNGRGGGGALALTPPRTAGVELPSRTLGSN